MATQTNLDSPSGRLLSLDVLRGFDMFWIVFGEVVVWSLAEHTGWAICVRISAELTHPAWHGFTFYDLIFPLFLFIAGVSFPYSMASRLQRGQSMASLHWHVIQRGLILFVLGLLRKQHGLLALDFANMNYPSVLGRIGIAYVMGALIAMHTTWRGRVGWALALLLGYWAAIT
jgi:predicted acyltransferase